MENLRFNAMPDYGNYTGEAQAQLYDLIPLYSERTDIDFYVQLAKETRGKVLELGCGTGRVTLPMASKSRRVVAFDHSADMLKRLEQKLADAEDTISEVVRLVEGDMTDFDLGEKFDLITIPFRGFQHMLTEDQQNACLDCIMKHLEPEGIFAFDVFNPNPDILFALTFGPVQDVPEFTAPDGRKISRVCALTHAHWGDSYNDYQFTYRIVYPDGRKEEVVHTTSLKYFFPDEIKKFVMKTGLRIKDIYGDFDRSPIEDSSPEIITLACL